MLDFHNWREFMFWWFASLVGATTIVVARICLKLFGQAADPPADAALVPHWERRRRWLAISEVSALPAFATVSVVLASYYRLDPVAGVLIALIEGGVGFPLLLSGAAWLFRQRVGMGAEKEPSDA